MTGKSIPSPISSFESWQVWPGSYDNPPPGELYPFSGKPGLRITRSTRIASMGSCFAREIKKVLLKKGFSYVQEEKDHPAAIHASAAWERLYSTFTMRQVFEYTFEDWNPSVRWWIIPGSRRRLRRVQDPYRRHIHYNTLKEAEEDFENHKRCSKRALERAQVLVITLGLTEIWKDREDGSVICIPSGLYVSKGGDMSRYQFSVSNYEDNLFNLERIHEIMGRANPDCRILVTVSPVHLWGTFRDDIDVISASCNSKSTLRAVANEFCGRHENVFYFPAYEMATIYLPMLGKDIYTSGREPFHVNPGVIDYIMSQFFRFYSVARKRRSGKSN